MDHLKVTFTELILADQNCFASEDGYEAFLQQIPDTRVVETLRTKWSEDPSRSSEDKWADFKSQISKYGASSPQRVGDFFQVPYL